MNVIFRTNLDQYRQVVWPVIDYKPNIGETVQVYPGSENLCKSLEIPNKLEIVGICHTTKGCIVELWYRQADIQTAKLNGTTKNLMGQ